MRSSPNSHYFVSCLSDRSGDTARSVRMKSLREVPSFSRSHGRLATSRIKTAETWHFSGRGSHLLLTPIAEAINELSAFYRKSILRLPRLIDSPSSRCGFRWRSRPLRQTGTCAVGSSLRISSQKLLVWWNKILQSCNNKERRKSISPNCNLGRWYLSKVRGGFFFNPSMPLGPPFCRTRTFRNRLAMRVETEAKTGVPHIF